MEKHLNDAIVGNRHLLITLTKKGEIQKIYYPTKDNKQFIDFYHVGIKANDSDLIYLHDDINNVYKQYYDINTNILNTEITNTYFNLKILQTDFVPIKENILIRKYTVINNGSIDLDIKFFIHSGILENNNFVGCKKVDYGIMQYTNDFILSTISQDKKVSNYQIKDSINNLESTNISDENYIGISKDSSVAYKIGNIKPNEKKILEICVVIQEQPNSISDFEKEIERIRKIDLHSEYIKTKNYWKKYVRDHDGLEMKEPENSYEERIQDIYYRSILLFPLLSNSETGGIIASQEANKNLDNNAYCWPRFATYIARAMDILKMDKETEKFYKVFCKKTQSKNGMWEQKFYPNGKLAPNFGYSVDETASVIYGVYIHYKYTKNFKFLKDCLPMCEKALDFLKRYVKDILAKTGKYEETYDLWEMNKGTNTYSLSAIYSAFDSMLEIYKILGKDVSNFENNRLKDEKISKSKVEVEKLRKELKLYIEEKMYDDEKKCYVRNPKDKKIDISILGAVTPFKVFSPKEKKIENTVERINMSLRTYTGRIQKI